MTKAGESHSRSRCMPASVSQDWLLRNFHPKRSTDIIVAATGPLVVFHLFLEAANVALTCSTVVSSISAGIHFSKQHLA